MNFTEAISLGNSVVGVIKCTYAELYNQSKHKLFSVQGRTTATDGEYYSILRDGTKQELMSRFPLVKIADTDGVTPAWSVACELSDEARLAIAGLLERQLYAQYWQFRRIWKKDYAPKGKKAGEIEVVNKTYTRPTEEKIAEWVRKSNEYYTADVWQVGDQDLTPAYQKLKSLIEAGGTVYVKPDAFVWYPTDIVASYVDDLDVNAQIADLNAQIAAKKADMEKAKKILVAAGLSSLI